jgi:hypothetical protein
VATLVGLVLVRSLSSAERNTVRGAGAVSDGIPSVWCEQTSVNACWSSRNDAQGGTSNGAAGAAAPTSAVEALLQAAVHDGTMVVRCVALFSLGTIFSHAAARRQSLSAQASVCIDALRDSARRGGGAGGSGGRDPASSDKFAAYLDRFLLNLNAQP